MDGQARLEGTDGRGGHKGFKSSSSTKNGADHGELQEREGSDSYWSEFRDLSPTLLMSDRQIWMAVLDIHRLAFYAPVRGRRRWRGVQCTAIMQGECVHI